MDTDPPAQPNGIEPPSEANQPSGLILMRRALWRNWISSMGLLLVAASFFSFLYLVLLDLFSPKANPYVGLLAYLVAPVFGAIGLAIFIAGIIIYRVLLHFKPNMHVATISFDIGRRTDRIKAFVFASVCFLVLLVSAFGSYRSYQYSESVEFCGETCHQVMQPEYVTYRHSSHARVDCSECHIGSGAEWFVKAKVNGIHQVLAVFEHNYHRPIETPLKNLRPAQDTCEHCHWPEKFVGNVMKTYRHFLTADDNPQFNLLLELKVGGANPQSGPVGGIHWHMNVANKIEYIATDEKRQIIPWVRMTDPNGKVTEYRSPDFHGDPSSYGIRRMDCMDCHNRPAHIFRSPNEALDNSMAQGHIDPAIKNIKADMLDVLNKTYATEQEAMTQIASALTAKHPNEPKIQAVIKDVEQIYSDNFFPAMKADWNAYPSNIGHKEFPGCFRCHDDKHVATDSTMKITQDCEACHVILAQGKDLEKFTPGAKFNHPGGDFGGMQCYECHNEKFADFLSSQLKPTSTPSTAASPSAAASSTNGASPSPSISAPPSAMGSPSNAASPSAAASPASGK